jgi:hypothetical protein
VGHRKDNRCNCSADFRVVCHPERFYEEVKASPTQQSSCVRRLQMCNIISFRFTCGHALRRRRSRCGGTKHKITANSIKAACITESLLTIYLRIECGPCQHKTWEDEWRLKLERANTFLTKLRQHNLPGVEAVTALVKELEAEYATASWDTRNMFAHAPKSSVTRVQYSHYEKKASKLPQEVRPEDIIDKRTKAWAEMELHEYDDNYEASTDPIHPVSTDYSHPLDDDDGAWILQHLSPEDLAGTQFDSGLDFNNTDHGWNWDGNSSNLEIEEAKNEWQSQNTFQDHEETGIKPCDEIGTGLVAWGPHTLKSLTTTLTSTPTTTQDEEHKARVAQVIETFWSVVNHSSATTNHSASHSSSSSSNDNDKDNDGNILKNLSDLTLTNSHNTPQPSPPPPELHHSPSSLWTDGPSDLLTPPPSPTSSSLLPHRLPLERSPNSTRAWYDKQRTFLLQRRTKDGGVDMTKFYKDWLYISRCEIRDFEGCEGRMIKDPLVVQRG